MSFLLFGDYYFLGAINIFFLYIWVFFFLCNNYFLKKQNFNKKIYNINTIKQRYTNVFLYFYKNVIMILLFLFFLLRGKNLLILQNHIYLNNFNLSYFYIFYFFVFFITNFKLTLVFSKIFLNKDYIFSIINLTLLLPLLFFVNTLFTFIFLFELISCFLFYNLLSSKLWYNKLSNREIKTPSSFINMIFFQYWVTFFATIFIVFSYINVFYFINSTE